jgi:hypothetical protein
MNMVIVFYLHFVNKIVGITLGNKHMLMSLF